MRTRVVRRIKQGGASLPRSCKVAHALKGATLGHKMLHHQFLAVSLGCLFVLGMFREVCREA